MSKTHPQDQAVAAAMRAARQGRKDGGGGLDRARAQGYSGPWYHGTERLDRLVSSGKIDPKRATSGPMPYFTDSPWQASNYAVDKADTSRTAADTGNVADYFTVHPKSLGVSGRSPISVERSWHLLSPEERTEIAAKAPHVGMTDQGDLGVRPPHVHEHPVTEMASQDHYAHVLREHKGNHLSALRDIWHDSGTLYSQEDQLAKVFRLAGYRHPISQDNAPWTQAQGVLPAMLRMRNPLDTSNHQYLRDTVIPHLQRTFRGDRSRKQAWGPDMWAKNVRFTPREWTDELAKDVASGANSHVWTTIPDKVTSALKGLGHDGILDTGGKMGGEGHSVAIPFEPHQVRSTMAQFDPDQLGQEGLSKAYGGAARQEHAAGGIASGGKVTAAEMHKAFQALTGRAHGTADTDIPLVGRGDVELPPGVGLKDLASELGRLRGDVRQYNTPQRRYWYENSGHSIGTATGWDQHAADRLTYALARTSPRTPVYDNALYSATAAHQHALGLPIVAGRFPSDMGKAIQRVWGEPDQGAIGPKIAGYQSGFRTAWTPGMKNYGANDQHNMNWLGWKGSKGDANTGQHNYDRFMRSALVHTLNKEGYDGGDWWPGQAQAVGWTKARAEGLGLDPEEAGYDITHAFRDRSGRMTYESAPGLTTGHFPEFHEAPYELKEAYHHDINKVLLDKYGRDKIAAHMGLLTLPTEHGVGYFEGRTSPGSHAIVVTGGAPGGWKAGLDPATRRLMQASERVRGHLLRQDAVAFHHARFPKGGMTWATRNTAQVNLGRPMKMHEAKAIHEAMKHHSGSDFFSPIFTHHGYRMLNVPAVSGVSNKAMHEAMAKAHPEAFPEEGTHEAISGYNDGFYESNDWKQHPRGEAYLQGLRADGPNVSGRAKQLFASLGPQLADIGQRYAKEQGWTPAPGAFDKPEEPPEGLKTGGRAGLAEGGVAPGFRPIKNPSPRALAALVGRSKENWVRGLWDGQDTHWWDAYHGTHRDAARALGIPNYLNGRIDATRDQSSGELSVGTEDPMPPHVLAPYQREGLAEGGFPHASKPHLFHSNLGHAHHLHVGPIHSAVHGRTDHLPMHVPSGSYVLPADVVSAHGEGNTMAGFKVMRRLFGGAPYGGSGGPYGQGGGPYGEALQNSRGGRAQDHGDEGVPIVAAGGEYVLSPDQVRGVGGGDPDLGTRVLDEFVKRSRMRNIKTLQRLPGPAKD